MHITITGMLGSGKSTICRILRDRYGFEIFSTGAIQREVAREKGVTTLELNEIIKIDHTLDDEIDETTTRISRERRGDKLIFDSRMAWHFATDTFKIFLTIDPMVAAVRVMADPRAEEPYETVEEARDMLIKRSRVARARFQELYGVDYYDKNNFNLVVDTSSRSPEEVVSLIMETYEAYAADPQSNQHKEYV